ATTNSTIEPTRQTEKNDHDAIIIQETDINDNVYIKIDCLNMEDLIKYKIKKLSFGSDTVNVEYQTYLLVNVDVTSNMTAKDVATLIVAKIEDGDDYS
ncbi:22251_t:CDS:1, partial [Racocetra persica]